MRRLLVALLALTLAMAPTTASAYANAFFPTQSSGNRGADVLAIQYLLQHHAQSVPADGVFGASTVTAAKAFQTAKGLGADGIVGPNTWAALVPTVRSGDNNAAVKALQVELNAKRRLSLPVDGVFGTAVRDAVVAFQSHAGIGADGIVGPITWRNLTWHYDYPDFTANLCDQDPDGNGTAANWATSAAVAQMEQAGRAFAGTGQGKIPYGDAGFEHGGDIPGHGSHEVGLDIDIWPIRTDNNQCTAGRITWQSTTYDRAATRQLVQAIRAAAPGHVRIIFFNDPTLIDEGLTTEWPAHDNHLHVRYCEKVHPNSLYTC
ncbi:peptidoglycan-binding protein [Kribbella sandramycini]|uniref:Peptidoglycan hydrolase-like protein with peptidoglycan-binding domain n=1 Tax=Kribbella sandramycini TaxID=60450 RepID=A0A7Y4L2I6_9ACTN|nr:penicillin-insensitive murein endopeptidase [Kribbella sandramycini]MBB6566200.1 peptidoglycan hydrolase-like protein with peptidoglycan-binding domain [Kribbella sandramycini]NOL43133.1 peptidoglycan-binding protein [Kribbella sandramycini]